MLGSDQKVIEDLGSEEVRLTRLELNKLLDFVDGVIDAAVANTGDGDGLATALAALDPSGLRKIVATIERPAAPSFPTP